VGVGGTHVTQAMRSHSIACYSLRGLVVDRVSRDPCVRCASRLRMRPTCGSGWHLPDGGWRRGVLPATCQGQGDDLRRVGGGGCACSTPGCGSQSNGLTRAIVSLCNASGRGLPGADTAMVDAGWRRDMRHAGRP
jgi:hypothetical protein